MKKDLKCGPTDFWKKVRIDEWERSNKFIPLDLWMNICRTGLLLSEILPYVLEEIKLMKRNQA